MANRAGRMSKILMTACQVHRNHDLSVTHLGEMCLNLLLNISFTVGIYILNFHARKPIKNYTNHGKPGTAEKMATQVTLLQTIIMIRE
jgi:hypothetical protein